MNNELNTIEEDYSSDLAGARGFLGEACTIMNQTGTDFVIIGGWIPYLFNTGDIPHPGTFDVDILLPDEVGGEELNKVIDIFLSKGYIRPVKNRFQLYRLLTVKGEKLAYHVDFLHRKYSDTEQSLPLDFEVANSDSKISIPTPGTDLIFTINERVKEGVKCVLPLDGEKVVDISFATEAGMLSSKGRSVNNEKRVRDAFDIFLILKQSRNLNNLIKRSNKNLGNAIFSKSMDEIFKSVYEGNAIPNIMRVLKIIEKQENIITPTEIEVISVFNNFFNRIGWQSKVANLTKNSVKI